MHFSWYKAAPLKWGQFYQKFSQKIHHSSPVGVRYWVSFVNVDTDWYSASDTAMMCATSCYIGLWYNNTRLYITQLVGSQSALRDGNNFVSIFQWWSSDPVAFQWDKWIQFGIHWVYKQISKVSMAYCKTAVLHWAVNIMWWMAVLRHR